jgi:lipid II:glycine glycyltransferase (peptidoglycan interpeptide bridge formation enzyme)
MEVKIEITNSPDIKQWSEFIYIHSQGNIFQTPEMAEVYRRTKNYEPICLAVVDSSDEVLVVLVAVVIKEVGGILGSFSAHSRINQGPLFLEDEGGIEAAKVLMEHYEKIVRKKALYTEVRNIRNTSEFSNLFNGLEYEYEERLNFLMNLNRTEEEIWRAIHKSRKKGINRAKNKGISIEKVEDKKDIPIFYDIVAKTYKRVSVPLADYSFFEAMFEILVQKNMADFYFAKYNGESVGARVVLKYKDSVYDWYAGSLPTDESLYVDEALVWHILKAGANNGYHVFDFGGAGKPNEEYGVREFKRRFGGDLANFRRYKKEHSPLKMKIAEKGFKVYRRIFK